MAQRRKGLTSQTPLARGQLSLVEHSLCPLNASAGPLVHEVEYFYGGGRNRRTGKARISCPLGMSPSDEFYLWGLLGLTCLQPEPNIHFYASARYCLRHLGLGQGGKQVQLLREAITRLGQVSYLNEAFYDPLRKERRSIGCGILSHDLPTQLESNRPWHIVWDPVFLQLAQASGGYLCFDLSLYRHLKPASRRLFLLLRKIFHRRATTPKFDVRHLAINVLGYASGMRQKAYNEKVVRCAVELADHRLVRLAGSCNRQVLVKVAPGVYQVEFQRGDRFHDRPQSKSLPAEDQARFEPLQRIGLNEKMMQHVLKAYSGRIVDQWIDVTLARMEQRLPFHKEPAAFFMHYLKLAAAGHATPPDWYLKLKKQQFQFPVERAGQTLSQVRSSLNGAHPSADTRVFKDYLRGECRAEYQQLVERLTNDFLTDGRQPQDAAREAVRLAREHLQQRFERLQHSAESWPLAPPTSNTTF